MTVLHLPSSTMRCCADPQAALWKCLHSRPPLGRHSYAPVLQWWASVMQFLSRTLMMVCCNGLGRQPPWQQEA